MVSALSYEISRVSHYSGFISPSLCFHIQDFHLLWFTFPGNSTNIILGFIDNPNPTNITIYGLGSSCFARHYFRNRYYFLFLWVLRCFSSPRSPTRSRVSRSSLDGLPHSDISGSRCICHSPELFAAYHVLLRLREPRHPPYALLCFLLSFRSSSFHSHELFARSVSFASNTSMIFCVENNGFEPLTPCLQSRCSSQLS